MGLTSKFLRIVIRSSTSFFRPGRWSLNSPKRNWKRLRGGPVAEAEAEVGIHAVHAVHAARAIRAVRAIRATQAVVASAISAGSPRVGKNRGICAVEHALTTTGAAGAGWSSFHLMRGRKRPFCSAEQRAQLSVTQQWICGCLFRKRARRAFHRKCHRRSVLLGNQRQKSLRGIASSGTHQNQ